MSQVPITEELLDDIPGQPGVYLLVLSLSQQEFIAIGSLGKQKFPSGYYLYTGSAHGPGGLRARLGRHLQGRGALFWHIDYLRRRSGVAAYWYSLAAPSAEHRTAVYLSRQGWLQEPVPGFGAADCTCSTHLFFCPDQDCLVLIQEDFLNGGGAVGRWETGHSIGGW